MIETESSKPKGVVKPREIAHSSEKEKPVQQLANLKECMQLKSKIVNTIQTATSMVQMIQDWLVGPHLLLAKSTNTFGTNIQNLNTLWFSLSSPGRPRICMGQEQ